MRVAWGSMIRLAQLLWAFLRHGLAHLLGSRAASWPILHRLLPMAGLPAPERLRILFEDMGGTFIKFGQMLALQPDILPVVYCDALFKLLDQVDAFGYDDVERIVIEELGRGPDEIFDTFNREPLATASVGQVHVAYLGRQKVAVKVQRPNVRTEFRSDIWLMVTAMTVIQRLHLKPLYWMIDPMTEFVSWTREELDYRFEARYSRELKSHPYDTRAQYVPEVFSEHSTSRVLVVEFRDGTTLLNYLRAREDDNELFLKRLDAQGFNRSRFAANVIENFLGNAFRFGIYHADLHPANLMILDNSIVGYVDFGITGVLSQYARSRLMKMTLALAEGDIDLLNHQFLELTVHGATSDLKGFRKGLDHLAQGWYEESPEGRQLRASFTQIMTEMLHLSRATNVMPERDIVKYIRSSIAIDGLITRFEPDFDLGRYLIATCSRYVKWHVRGNRFTVDKMLDWSSASGQLLQDGATRGARVLDRLTSGELPARVELVGSEAEEQEALRNRALQLAGAAFGASMLMAIGPKPAGLGFNLWTAELAFSGAALIMLVGALRRLSWSRGVGR